MTPTIPIAGQVAKGHGGHDAIQYGQGSKTSWASFRVFASNGKREDGSYGDSYGVTVKCFGPLADHVAASLHERDSVIIIGRIRDTRWKDRAGNDQYGTEVVADEIGMSLRWDSLAKTSDAPGPTGEVGPRETMRTGADPWGDYAPEPAF